MPLRYVKPQRVLRRNLRAYLSLIVAVCVLSSEPNAEQSQVSRKVVVVPFEEQCTKLLFQCQVNGKSVDSCLLDTGGEGALLDESVTDNLGLKRLRTATAKGVGEGSLTMHQLMPVTIALGVAQHRFANVFSADMREISEFLGRRVSVLIGASFFSSVVGTIDFDHHALRLFDSAVSGTSEHIPLALRGGLPFVNLTLFLNSSSKVTGSFELDTGADTMTMHGDFASANRIRENHYGPALLFRAPGIGGFADFTQMRFYGLGVGKWTLPAPVVEIAGRGDIEHNAGDGGVVGMSVFRRFNVTFDYASGRLGLKPNKRFRAAFEGDLSGIQLARSLDSEQLRVAQIRPGSPADQAGLKVGDVIISINGKQPRQVDLDQICNWLSQVGKRIDFVVQRGAEKVTARFAARREV